MCLLDLLSLDLLTNKGETNNGLWLLIDLVPQAISFGVRVVLAPGDSFLPLAVRVGEICDAPVVEHPPHGSIVIVSGSVRESLGNRGFGAL